MDSEVFLDTAYAIARANGKLNFIIKPSTLRSNYAAKILN